MITAGLRPFAVEVFCGSGRYTKALRSMGIDAWGIDWKGGRLSAETPALLHLNLTTDADTKTFKHLLRHPMLIYCHMAPPCGTCSRAREIPLRDGRPGPPPLRSELHPRGFPDLEQRLPREAPRVAAANLLYDLVVEATTQLISRDILWSIENPRDSLLWHYPGIFSFACA